MANDELSCSKVPLYGNWWPYKPIHYGWCDFASDKTRRSPNHIQVILTKYPIRVPITPVCFIQLEIPISAYGGGISAKKCHFLRCYYIHASVRYKKMARFSLYRWNFKKVNNKIQQETIIVSDYQISVLANSKDLSYIFNIMRYL